LKKYGITSSADLEFAEMRRNFRILIAILFISLGYSASAWPASDHEAEAAIVNATQAIYRAIQHQVEIGISG
jgi:hypothetical protein